MLQWESARLLRETRGLQVLVALLSKQKPSQDVPKVPEPVLSGDSKSLEELQAQVQGLRAGNERLMRELAGLEALANRLNNDKIGQGHRGSARSWQDAVVQGAVQSMPRDGSCLFHALAYGLGQKGVTASTLRAEICDFIELNHGITLGGKPLSDWLLWESGQDHSEYAAQMRSSSEWGGPIEMAIFSIVYGVHVHVYQELNGDEFQRICNFDDAGDKLTKTVSVVLRPGHYDALVVIKD